ncbi:MAG: hypothetical protein IKF78_09095 [Atopobiaceae bacterium]|nr:hypothetical protein [Atopobiaceae bacterium]
MSICLCNLSADTALELAAQEGRELLLASPDASTFVADMAQVRETLGDFAEKLPYPIELLVDEQTKRRRSSNAVCHVWKGPLPKNGVFELHEGVYVSSPEFTLLQQASQLHQANLCQMLGRYLGTWTPAKDKPLGQDKRAPLTSFESINEFLSGVGHAWGKRNLKMAMAYTCEGAASAPETSLQLALTLPPELHGLGIVQPIMNYEVELSAEAQRLYPHESIRIDLCWRNKGFGLEYQGEEHGNRLGEDCARCFAARKMDYELWFVAKEQLESAVQMMDIGRELANRIDADVDEETWPSEGEFQDLLDVLAGKEHPKPVGYAELRKRKAELRHRERKTSRSTKHN